MAQMFKRNSGPKEPVKQVRLKLRSIDVWSAAKVGFYISIALAIATLVGAFLVWLVLANSGVLGSVGGLLSSILGEGSNVDLESDFALGNVMSTAGSIALLNIVLTTALTTVWAAIFNLIGKLVGGVSLTFTNN
jgi:spore maturation protein SpmB